MLINRCTSIINVLKIYNIISKSYNLMWIHVSKFKKDITNVNVNSSTRTIQSLNTSISIQIIATSIQITTIYLVSFLTSQVTSQKFKIQVTGQQLESNLLIFSYSQ